ncbi:MAG: ankyrin repeat domain-containing protein, partial [Lysobacteraceae bacterium]
PLLAATRDSWHGRIEAVTMLLANGADPRVTDADGNTPLHHSARSSDASVAALLLDAGAQVDTCNHERNSALFVACAGANWRLARFLLEHGARCEPGEGQPALLAAASGEDEIAGVQLLLKHKARVDARGNTQRTALMLACEAGNPEIVGTLLDARAAINARDGGGMTALMHAAANGNESVLPRLAKAKPDASTVDDEGLNAVAHACRSEHSEPSLIRTLLGMGVNPQHVSADGRTSLDHAVAAGRWRLVAELDPTHALPETIAEDIASAPAQRSAQDLLRDALAARRFDRAQALLQTPAADHAELLAILLPQFALEADADVFDWLLRHGADAERRNGFDDNVLFTLLDRGGTFAGAIARLLDHGVSPSGTNGLARYLAACAASEASSRTHEHLALGLLERGADASGVLVSDTGLEGDTPLALAIRLGWMRLAEQLLERGAAVDARDSNALTPLHLATSLGREAAVKLLVRSGANSGLRTPNGETALGMALATDRNDLGKWLEWRGWRLPRRPLRDTDLPAAAMVGDAGAVIRLIDLGLPINAVDSQGCSALLRAAGGGHLEVLDALLKRGADTAIAAATGATALSAAVSMRHAQVVERLLEHGANVDQPVAGGVTPLMLAAALGLPEMVARLLAHRADLRKTDESGLGALHCACMHAFHSHDRQRTMALLDTLLLSDADVDAASRSGETPLLLLLGSRAEPGRPRDEDLLLEAMESLLDEKVRLDAHDHRGFTPLHMAALHGLGRVVQRLLRAGANPRPLDSTGRTPHQLALQRGLIDIAAEFEPVRSAATPSLARFLRKE